MNTPAAMGLIFVGALFSLITLGLLYPEGFVPKLGPETVSITYTDYISIMLTALAVILAALAFFVGVLAIVGWGQIRTSAEERARQVAREMIAESLKKNGDLRKLVEKAFEDGGELHDVARRSVRALEADIYAGITQLESSGATDPDEDDPEEKEEV